MSYVKVSKDQKAIVKATADTIVKRCSLSPREIRRSSRNYRNMVKSQRSQTWEPHWRIVKMRIPKRKGIMSFEQALAGVRMNGKH